MGVLLSKKLEHPVLVRFTCERCGEENSFAQDIQVAVSKEIPFNSRSQALEIVKLDQRAKEKLKQRIQDIERQVAAGRFSWVDDHPCSKCKAAQSWQKSGLRMQLVVCIVWFPTIGLLFGRWFMDFLAGNRPFLAWILFLVLGVLSLAVLIVMIRLIRSLSQLDRSKNGKPTVVV